ncbi:MAG: NAD-dependent protein deacylase [Clostridia bacterium]|nr:NAD-dependent protein deacylase [Clostridia bacterium]
MSIQKLREAMQKAERICVFTGAGISCPSGIPDFRSAKGLYSETDKSGYAPEEIIFHSFFVKHTDLFYEFYKSKMMYPEAEPNKAHLYFAQLEKQGKKVSVVTQNIDGLHSKAGCTEVYELHGSVHRNFCLDCGSFFDGDYVYKSADVPKCEKCGGTVKPDVVLYEEGLDDNVVKGALKAIREADLLIIIGTSLAVYPAASFVGYFKGETIVLINKSPTPYDQKADIVIYDDIINVIEHLV